MNKNIILIGIVIIAVLGVGGWFYLTGSPAPQTGSPAGMDTKTAEPTPIPAQNPAQTPQGTVNTPLPTTNQPAPAVSQKEFTVTAQNYSFTPSAITVKKGDKVKITLKNVEGFHDLKLDEFNVATERVSEGQEKTIEFVADKTGTFEYYCSVGNHRAMGMKGTFTVEE